MENWKMIEIKLYEYQVHEILILLYNMIHKLEEEKEKKENACNLSFYVTKISILERIKDILTDSLNKE